MRILILLLAAGVGYSLVAAPRPISNKEIGLMLRSGFTSEGILAEIGSRHLLEPLDDATKKMLLDFRASPQLIAALENNANIVSESQAEQARQLEAEITARRAAQIEQDRRLNTLQQAQLPSKSAAPPPPGETLILDALKDHLVRCHEGAIDHADASELGNKKFVALYYSAHWCGPCRKFTPQLVDYYNRVAAAHPEFELIFVSADRSRSGWETYIREAKMPWLAVDYETLQNLAAVRQLGGSSIPSLIVLDAGSRLLASSYDGEKYVGPQNAIAALDRLLAGGSTTAVAQSR